VATPFDAGWPDLRWPARSVTSSLDENEDASSVIVLAHESVRSCSERSLPRRAIARVRLLCSRSVLAFSARRSFRATGIPSPLTRSPRRHRPSVLALASRPGFATRLRFSSWSSPSLLAQASRLSLLGPRSLGLPLRCSPSLLAPRSSLLAHRSSVFSFSLRPRFSYFTSSLCSLSRSSSLARHPLPRASRLAHLARALGPLVSRVAPRASMLDPISLLCSRTSMLEVARSRSTRQTAGMVIPAPPPAYESITHAPPPTGSPHRFTLAIGCGPTRIASAARIAESRLIVDLP